MSGAPDAWDPAHYSCRELFLSLDQDAATRVVLIPPGSLPDALNCELLADAVNDQLHVLIAATNEADLRRGCETFRAVLAAAPKNRTLH